MQIRICFDTQHMFVMLMHTILCNTSNNGSSREISFTRDKTGVKPSTLERSLHRQCVRRCISVDHRWIIFHLITRQLLRADESQGIKNLIPHKNTSVLAKKKVEVQKSDCQILSMRIGRRWENQWQRRWEAMVVTARIVWRNLLRRNFRKKSSLSLVPAAAITRWEQSSNLRSLMISVAATESQEINLAGK